MINDMFLDVDDMFKGLINRSSYKGVDKVLVGGSPTDVLANGGENANFNGRLVREPVFPEWFFTARIGQPRKINYLEIRKFARSPWVQMVINTIKKEIMTIPWDVESADEEDELNESLKEEVKSFLEKVDSESNSILDICNEGITDIAEIDALTWVKVYSNDSYEMKEVPVLNDVGNVIGVENRPVLKPFGKRKLLEVRSADPATFLKQIDIFKRMQYFYQYSWKNPRSSPLRFEPDEVAYNMMNKRSYKLYGFSPIQSIQQILELLIQSTRFNKDNFKNNAFPDGIISLPGANPDSMKQFKELWLKQVKGKPHKLIWHNTDAKFTPFNLTNRDMEWLEGQKWFFHLVFGVYGVSPTEAGFHENVNRSTQEGQERVTVKNAIKPYLKLLEETINKFVLPDLLQDEKPLVRFVFKPKDHVAEQIEFDQAMAELDKGTLTINEYRRLRGREPISGGDEPSNLASSRIAQEQLSVNSVGVNNKDDGLVDENGSKKKGFVKSSDLDAGSDVVEEADDYSDFMEKTVSKWEKRVVGKLERTDLSKKNDSFGEFLAVLMNSVNTLDFQKVIRGFIKGTLNESIGVVEDELGVQIGFTKRFNDLLGRLEKEQFEGYVISGKKWHGIRGATKQTRFKILKEVEDGLSEGLSKSEIVKSVRSVFKGSTLSQAVSIARTETTRFLGMGKLEAFKESELGLLKVPVAAMDSRTSDLCRRLNNKYKGEGVGLDEEYVDDVTGKSFMNPPHHPQCRCTLVSDLKDKD